MSQKRKYTETEVKPEGKMILDEARAFLARFVVATEAQLDAMTLFSAATHGAGYFETFPRMAFLSELAVVGKSSALTITRLMSSQSVDAGKDAPLQASLIAAADKPIPTLYVDEVQDIFGRSGLNVSKHKFLAEVARKGYKKVGATSVYSKNKSSISYSIFTPIIFAGLGNALPHDIRTRTIIITMEYGVPKNRFTSLEECPANIIGQKFSHLIKQHEKDLKAFEAEGIHPAIQNRKLEIWGPLLAVAYALGGESWLNRAVQAFIEITREDSDTVVLSPQQIVVKDALGIVLENGQDFMPGMKIAAELKKKPHPLYKGRSNISLCLLLSENLCKCVMRRVEGVQFRGYLMDDLMDLWRKIAPAIPQKTVIPDAHNPFEISDNEGDDCEGDYDCVREYDEGDGGWYQSR